MGRAPCRTMGPRKRAHAVRARGAARCRRCVHLRRADSNPHRDRDAPGAGLQCQGDIGLRHGSGIHLRYCQPTVGRLEPCQYRVGRLLRHWVRRVCAGHGAGRSCRHRGHASGFDAVLPEGHSRQLPCRPASPSCRGDPRPSDLPRRMGGAGIAAGRLLRPRSARRSDQRGRRRRRAGADRDRRARTSHSDRPGDPRGPLAGRDLLTRHVSGRLRHEQRRARRRYSGTARTLGRGRCVGRPCFPQG